jgi:hypothetical protein
MRIPDLKTLSKLWPQHLPHLLWRQIRQRAVACGARLGHDGLNVSADGRAVDAQVTGDPGLHPMTMPVAVQEFHDALAAQDGEELSDGVVAAPATGSTAHLVVGGEGAPGGSVVHLFGLPCCGLLRMETALGGPCRRGADWTTCWSRCAGTDACCRLLASEPSPSPKPRVLRIGPMLDSDTSGLLRQGGVWWPILIFLLLAAFSVIVGNRHRRLSQDRQDGTERPAGFLEWEISPGHDRCLPQSDRVVVRARHRLVWWSWLVLMGWCAGMVVALLGSVVLRWLGVMPAPVVL